MANLRQRPSQTSEVMPGGQLEPIEPVYTAVNRQSALGTRYPIPSEPAWDFHRAPVVRRAQDTRGMRYLWADIRQRQPISPLGTGKKIGIAVWSSSFQPILGTLRDYGFYDLLYRAGYPGFNLGLSFKVQQNPIVGTQGPGYNIRMQTSNKVIVNNPFRRTTWPASSRKG